MKKHTLILIGMLGIFHSGIIRGFAFTNMENLLTVYYYDGDGDGYGSPDITVNTPTQPVGYVTNNDDCADWDNTIHPGGIEICNGQDDDCDGSYDEGGLITLHPNIDGDGYPSPSSYTFTGCYHRPDWLLIDYPNPTYDCDDMDPNVGGICSGLEVCNGIDDDGNGLIDSDDPGITSLMPWYPDADNDGYGDPNLITFSCSPPAGYKPFLPHFLDCDDSNAAINPGALEICNGIDDNCDGSTDIETCGNGIDEDCDGLIDESGTIWVPDFDGDGNSNGIVFVNSCTAPGGWYDHILGNDCDDADPYIISECVYLEICNGIDDDEDGLIDNADPDLNGAKIPWYADADGDGFADWDTWILAACPPPGQYIPWSYDVEAHRDCDDSNPAIHPGAQELCNGIDDNCDGLPDPEICNSIDTDCDGVPDNVDVCPGGDDSVDNNGDNIPDCSQLLNYNEYSPDWYCGNNKIYVCHNDNNPQTICIDKSALPTHYNHGDKIGPCTSCGQNLIVPGSNGLPIAIVPERTEQQDMDASGVTIFPNPAGKEVTFYLYGFEDEGVELTLFDYSGRAIWQSIIEHGRHEQRLDLSVNDFANGVYIVKVGSAGKVLTGRLVVFR